jgi:hypothetical protein
MTLSQWWHRLVQVTALGLILGVLLTPVGLAHLDLKAGVCHGPAAAAPGAPRLVQIPSLDLHRHCFTCHWLQSFRSTLLGSGAIVFDAAGACEFVVADSHGCESVPAAAVPARAPPVLSA